MIFNSILKSLTTIFIFILFLTSGCFRAEKKPEPVNAEFYYNRGLEFLKSNVLDKAERELKYAVELDDKFAPAHLGLAIIHYRNKQFTASEYHVDKAIKLNTNQPDAFLLKGKILFQKSEYNQSLKYINKTADLLGIKDEKYRENLKSEIFLWRGLCLKNLNNYELAAIELAAALKLDPKNPTAIRVMDEIRLSNEMTLGLSQSITNIVHKNIISRRDWATLLISGLSKNFFTNLTSGYLKDIDPPDVAANDDIMLIVRLKLINIYPDGEVKPELNLSWAEVIISVIKILEAAKINYRHSKPIQSLFSDLDPLHPLYNDAACAQSLGIFKNLSKQSFLLSDNVKGLDALYVIRNLDKIIK